MMGNQVLRTADDPGEIADAKLFSLGEGGCDRETGRVAEAASPLGCVAKCRFALDGPRSNRLSER